jgi:hypothetical protein
VDRRSTRPRLRGRAGLAQVDPLDVELELDHHREPLDVEPLDLELELDRLDLELDQLLAEVDHHHGEPLDLGDLGARDVELVEHGSKGSR